MSKTTHSSGRLTIYIHEDDSFFKLPLKILNPILEELALPPFKGGDDSNLEPEDQEKLYDILYLLGFEINISADSSYTPAKLYGPAERCHPEEYDDDINIDSVLVGGKDVDTVSLKDFFPKLLDFAQGRFEDVESDDINWDDDNEDDYDPRADGRFGEDD